MKNSVSLWRFTCLWESLYLELIVRFIFPSVVLRIKSLYLELIDPSRLSFPAWVELIAYYWPPYRHLTMLIWNLYAPQELLWILVSFNNQSSYASKAFQPGLSWPPASPGAATRQPAQLPQWFGQQNWATNPAELVNKSYRIGQQIIKNPAELGNESYRIGQQLCEYNKKYWPKVKHHDCLLLSHSAATAEYRIGQQF